MIGAADFCACRIDELQALERSAADIKAGLGSGFSLHIHNTHKVGFRFSFFVYAYMTHTKASLEGSIGDSLDEDSKVTISPRFFFPRANCGTRDDGNYIPGGCADSIKGSQQLAARQGRKSHCR